MSRKVTTPLRDPRPAARPGTLAGVACGLLLAFSQGLCADTLLVDAVAATRDTAAERPTRGMTMATVERLWGAPNTRTAAVGAPPITRWEYPGFTVFFEYRHVVHAVARTP